MCVTDLTLMLRLKRASATRFEKSEISYGDLMLDRHKTKKILCASTKNPTGIAPNVSGLFNNQRFSLLPFAMVALVMGVRLPCPLRLPVSLLTTRLAKFCPLG